MYFMLFKCLDIFIIDHKLQAHNLRMNNKLLGFLDTQPMREVTLTHFALNT